MTGTGDLVFVYGTLRPGQPDHQRLLAGRDMAAAFLDGHALRLGAGPWVQAVPGSVAGEVVAVNADVLAQLDARHEVAGGRYRRKRRVIRLATGTETQAWVFLAGSVAATGERHVPGDDWLGAFVWYVAYGSNLSADRFHRYLERCRDVTPPWRWAPVEVPHRLLFARQSSRWGGGGVAFLDPLPTVGATTLGRAWLLTREQFADVLAQECGLPIASVEVPDLGAGFVIAQPDHWYGCVVPLGRHQGWPLVTFTDEGAVALVPGRPGPAYRAVVALGLSETHGLTADEAEAYIARHAG